MQSNYLANRSALARARVGLGRVDERSVRAAEQKGAQHTEPHAHIAGCEGAPFVQHQRRQWQRGVHRVLLLLRAASTPTGSAGQRHTAAAARVIEPARARLVDDVAERA